MKSNRESSRILNDSARRMISKCKAFVLVTINKDNQIETTREIRGLAHLHPEDPLREEFLKMCSNLETGSVIVNGRHIRYLAIQEQEKKAEMFKKTRSEELGQGV